MLESQLYLTGPLFINILYDVYLYVLPVNQHCLLIEQENLLVSVQNIQQVIKYKN